MALFKISRGSAANLPATLTEGFCWYTYDDSKFYIDYKDENDQLVRKAINAKDAETLTGASLSTILNSSDIEIPTSKAVLNAIEAVNTEIYNTAAAVLSETRERLSEVSEEINTTAAVILAQAQADASEKAAVVIADTQEKIDAVNARIDGLDLGGGVEITQSTGNSETAVMSQKAVTEELEVVDNRIERIFGTTEYVEEAVYYDGSKLTYSDSVDGCEYDYSAHAIAMIFNESDFVVDNPIYIKFLAYCYSATYHAYGYIYKSSDGQIYIGDQEINTDADAALYMHKDGNEIHVIMYLPDSSASWFSAYASIPFTVSYNESYASTEIIPEKLLYITKEVEVYDVVREAIYAQTAATATTASTATKASQDSNGYSFTTYYAKAPSSNPLSISGNNLQVKYTKGNNTTTSYSIDLSKATAITNALSSATTAATRIDEITDGTIAEEGTGRVLFDSSELKFQDDYTICNASGGNLFMKISKNSLSSNEVLHIQAEVNNYNYTYYMHMAFLWSDNRFTCIDGDFYDGYTIEIRETSTDLYVWLGALLEENYADTIISSSCAFELYDQPLANYTSYQLSVEPYYKKTIVAVTTSKTLYDEATGMRFSWADIQKYIDDKIAAALNSSSPIVQQAAEEIITNGEW